ncbi:mitochondrial inner membrane protein [Apiospora kogelbergensis]|uniref:Sensitive to high expression protein 9, mitochondrial n=1 Tax=Apiospora kogelbergensis TaxID=1337665 RepID=A0AAW0QIP4_9PEZI
MPPSRVWRPILGMSTRLLYEQSPTITAVSPSRRLKLVLDDYSFNPQCKTQLRWSSSNPKPPHDPSRAAPDFSHLDPSNVTPPPAPRTSSSTSSSSSSSTPSSESSSNPSKSAANADFISKDGKSPSEKAASATTSSTITTDPALPSQSTTTSPLANKFATFMDRFQSSLFKASQRVNVLTGYTGIETLKSRIADLEESLAAAQEHLHEARNTYKSRVSERSATQREVTTLLARQKTWTPADFERFTSLYRSDYELETGVADSARELEEAERETERLNRDLSSGILARYHEEQIWSDKIRRMSTWGTWGLMGVNVLLFLVFQFGAEPWRRARLVRGFEQKVREALEEERIARDFEKEEDRQQQPVAFAPMTAFEEPAAHATTVPATTAEVGTSTDPDVMVEGVPVEIDSTHPTTPMASWRETIMTPSSWKDAARDLVSDRKVAIRMRDVSLVALEGVAAGAAVAGTIAVFFVRRT